MKNPELLKDALLTTARRISIGKSNYQWGHMGRCNVGQLVQTLTGRNSASIVASVRMNLDEWSEHARSYCENTGQDVDDLFSELASFGMTTQDIMSLEYLSDRKVLENLEGGFRYLERNNKDDVASYMKSFASLIKSR